MATHLNRWWPDTCGCAVVQEFDDALPPESVSVGFSFVEKPCDAHKPLLGGQIQDSTVVLTEIKDGKRQMKSVAVWKGPGGKLLWDTINEENRRKNDVVRRVNEKAGKKFDEPRAWSFDAQRNLVVDTSDLSSIDRVDLANEFTVKHGNGKVKVQ